jgi:hypothetical protein
VKQIPIRFKYAAQDFILRAFFELIQHNIVDQPGLPKIHRHGEQRLAAQTLQSKIAPAAVPGGGVWRVGIIFG